MCGIIGYSGHRPAVPLLMEGLQRLEYRGYDSAGVAYMQAGRLEVVKSEGKLAALAEKLSHIPSSYATLGIGHTRWATHGVPAERNAHPHCSASGSLSLVHNGIIENYLEIKEELVAEGCTFRSETDTEVLACYMDSVYLKAPELGLEAAFRKALSRVRGAYAVVMVSTYMPDTIFAARMSSPLLLGVGTGEYFVASDIPAFLPYTREVVFLDEGEMAVLTCNSYAVKRLADGELLNKEIHHIPWDMQGAAKGGYRHFMIKEIFEQPRVLRDCLAGRVLDAGQITAPTGMAANKVAGAQKEPENMASEMSGCAAAKSDTPVCAATNSAALRIHLAELDAFSVPERLRIVACGTSYHAGLWARPYLEQLAGIPVEVEIASEFRYRNPCLSHNEVVLVISQSGETADTLAALRLAQNCGHSVIGLCNVLGSSIAREANVVLYTQAGPEISVASTKAMLSQMTVLLLVSVYYAQRKQLDTVGKSIEYIQELLRLPDVLEQVLPSLRERAHELALEYAFAKSFFYLGRGNAFALALEGALKLKELSYIHAEGYAAGEMKHGPIALIDPSFPTLALAFDDDLLPKMKSNVEQVQARQGKVIVLAQTEGVFSQEELWLLPQTSLPAFVALPALQLFSYEMADYLGKDVDQPRNLAKSVTVE